MILRRNGDTLAIPRSEESWCAATMYPVVRERIVQTYKRLRRKGIDARDAKDVVWDMVFAMYLYHQTTPVEFKSILLT